MGVRLAVGATRASVLRLVAGQALRLVVSGLVLGLGAALLLSGSITNLLFDVEPRDLSIFTFAPAVLLAAGLLASYIPARRATRVDPVVALRGD
jgi:putative ABC transport system permease protein